MRTVKALQWKIPNLSALRVPTIALPKLTLSEKTILLAALLSAFIDVVNTAVIYLYDAQGSFLAMLKGVVLLVVVANYRTAYSFIVTASIFTIFLLRELTVIATSQPFFFSDDCVFFLRIYFFIAWLLLFYEKRNCQAFLDYVFRIFIALSILCVACQMIGAALHLSYFLAYPGVRGGYKGIFNAPNETGIFYLLALIYAMHLWTRGRRLYTVVPVAGSIALALGSKTALLGVILIPLLYFIFYKKLFSKNSLKRVAKNPRTALVWIGSSSVLLIAIYFAVNRFTDILTAINYDQFLRVYQESGFISSFLSLRDVKATVFFQSINTLPGLLFGQQINAAYRSEYSNNAAGVMYEIDGVDFLARVGLLGTLLTLALIWKTAALRHWTTLSPERKTLVVSMFIVGCTSGHTLVSSMNGIWISFWFIAFGSEYCLP